MTSFQNKYIFTFGGIIKKGFDINYVNSKSFEIYN